MSGEAALSSDGFLSAWFGRDLHSPMTTIATSASPLTNARWEILICLFGVCLRCRFVRRSCDFSHVFGVDESLHNQRLSPPATIRATTLTHIGI
jgi:hypothetical protein